MSDDGASLKVRRSAWSIRTLMVVILVVAVDTALAKGLAAGGFDGTSSLVVVLVIAYDALAYFSWLALVEMWRGRTGFAGWKSRVVVVVGSLVLVGFAGLPLAVAAMAILGFRL